MDTNSKDIDKNVQINTFIGGMNTDTSDAMLDSSQYRRAENLRIIASDGTNSGELHSITGTKETGQVKYAKPNTVTFNHQDFLDVKTQLKPEKNRLNKRVTVYPYPDEDQGSFKQLVMFTVMVTSSEDYIYALPLIPDASGLLVKNDNEWISKSIYLLSVDDIKSGLQCGNERSSKFKSGGGEPFIVDYYNPHVKRYQNLTGYFGNINGPAEMIIDEDGYYPITMSNYLANNNSYNVGLVSFNMPNIPSTTPISSVSLRLTTRSITDTTNRPKCTIYAIPVDNTSIYDENVVTDICNDLFGPDPELANVITIADNVNIVGRLGKSVTDPTWNDPLFDINDQITEITIPSNLISNYIGKTLKLLLVYKSEGLNLTETVEFFNTGLDSYLNPNRTTSYSASEIAPRLAIETNVQNFGQESIMLIGCSTDKSCTYIERIPVTTLYNSILNGDNNGFYEYSGIEYISPISEETYISTIAEDTTITKNTEWTFDSLPTGLISGFVNHNGLILRSADLQGVANDKIGIVHYEDQYCLQLPAENNIISGDNKTTPTTAATDNKYFEYDESLNEQTIGYSAVGTLGLNVGVTGTIKVTAIYNSQNTNEYGDNFPLYTAANNVSMVIKSNDTGQYGDPIVKTVTPQTTTLSFNINKTGTVLIYSSTGIKITKIEYEPAPEVEYDIDGTILAMTNNGDVLSYIVVSKDLKSWSLYKTTEQRLLDNQPSELIAGPFTKKIWDTSWEKDKSSKPVCLYISYESDNNIKLFIADGIHLIFFIMLSDGYLGDDLDKILKDQNTLLPTPTGKLLSHASGVKSGVNQYAYIIYSLNGSFSKLSPLSDVVSIYKDTYHGYKYDVTTDKCVKVTIRELPKDSDLNIKLFRISYQLAGQEPLIHVIYDGSILNDDFIDAGLNVEQITTEELIAYGQDKVIANSIEAKDNYLFAANVTYTQTKTDELFEKFDARCYNTGSKVLDEYVFANVSNTDSLQDILSNNTTNMLLINNKYLNHDQFKTLGYSDFELDYWKSIGASGYNGIGPCFAWKYKYEGYKLRTTILTNETSNSRRSYRRNEVYRFGVRLFDSKGNASSVKWIADIKMPGWLDNSSLDNVLPYLTLHTGSEKIENTAGNRYYVEANQLGISFTPVNTSSDLWKNVAAYQIVRCVKTVDDSYFIAQGMTGFPQFSPAGSNQNESRLCSPLFLTDSLFTIDSGDLQLFNILGNKVNSLWRPDPNKERDNGLWGRAEYLGCRNAYLSYNSFYGDKNNPGKVVEFASPEYCYLPDDIKSLLKSNSVVLQNVSRLKGPYIDRGLDTKHYGVSSWYLNSHNILNNDSPIQSFSEYGHKLYPKLIYSDDSKKFLIHFVKSKIGIFSLYSLYIGSDERNPSRSYYIDNGLLTLLVNRDFGPYWETGDYSVPELRSGGDRRFYKMYIENPSDDNGKPQPTRSYIYTSYLFNCVPYGKENTKKKDNFSIESYVPVSAKTPSDFRNYNNMTLFSSMSTIDNKYYYNFTNPFLYTVDTQSKANGSMSSHFDEWYKKWASTNEYPHLFNGEASPFWALTSSGNDKLLLSLDKSPGYKTNGEGGSNDWGSTFMPDSWITTIRKNAIPYGGYAKELYTHGYLPQGQIVKMASGTQITSDIYDGDCFIKLFLYNQAHAIHQQFMSAINTALITYCVPIESNIDLQADFSSRGDDTGCADAFSNDNGFLVQRKPVDLTLYRQTQNYYMYNTAYNVTPNVPLYYSVDQSARQAKVVKYPNRVHVSQRKYANESIDSWLLFNPIDFIDVNSKYGDITDLRLFKNQLLFWLQQAVGTLSVNDRSLITDEDSKQLVLGTGDILSRYDYITNTYGQNLNTRAVAISDSAVYWWDGYVKAILAYAVGSQVVDLGSAKHIRKYLSEGDENETPELFYDRKHNEIVSSVVNKESVVYNETTGQFTSIYTFTPVFYADLFYNGIVTGHNISNEATNRIYLYNTISDSGITLFDNSAAPYLKYVVNAQSTFNKTFDNQSIGGMFDGLHDSQKHITFKYHTPLNLNSEGYSEDIVTDREYDLRLAIPRNANSEYGDRMRGKTMECEIESINNKENGFALQYITTKFRPSWS